MTGEIIQYLPEDSDDVRLRFHSDSTDTMRGFYIQLSLKPGKQRCNIAVFQTTESCNSPANRMSLDIVCWECLGTKTKEHCYVLVIDICHMPSAITVPAVIVSPGYEGGDNPDYYAHSLHCQVGYIRI